MGLEGGLGMGLLAPTFDVESVVFPGRGSHFLAFYGADTHTHTYSCLWGWREALGWACWRQLSMSKVWYSLGGAHTFWLSMGLIHIHILIAVYGAGGRPWDGLVGVNFRCRKCGIP